MAMQIPEEYKQLDLYDVLKITKESSAGDIKRAFRKRALETHPDKAGESSRAEFQQVAFAYSVLSDDEKRETYNSTGSVEDLSDVSIRDLFTKYMRTDITKDIIEQDRKAYRESEEERQDVLESYVTGDGDVNYVLESVIHSEISDQERLIAIISTAIDAGEVEELPKFKKTSSKSANKRRLRRADKESAEVDDENSRSSKSGKTDGMADLAAAIQKRSANNFDNLISKLESKYADEQPKKKAKKSKSKV